jgi:putative transposase
MTAAHQLGRKVGRAAACRALNVPRASLYRHLRRSEPASPPAPRPSPPRALAPAERQQVLEQLHSERFRDRAPVEVFATLLDEGAYLCSVRTMYRLLEQAGEVRERRDQLRHPSYQKPQLLATAPNQVWSWDITKLLGPAKWTYFYLYVILDIFSRYVVGWMVAPRESAELAKRLIGETCRKQLIAPEQLTIHADRGTSMTSKPVALLLADLGVTKTHSRPHVSDDNPFSESQFKTLKYRPEFPARFGSIQDARGFCQAFFPWYNLEHHHSGIGLLTPEMLHYGRADQIIDQRQAVLSQAFERNPERFVRAHPKPPARPTTVWINPPPALAASDEEQH